MTSNRLDLLLTSLLLLSQACGSTSSTDGLGSEPDVHAGCAADPAWISSPSMPQEVANGKSASNCDFQQFAWQSFLDVIIDPDTGKPAVSDGLTEFETWMDDAGVFVPAGESPVPWGQTPPPPPSCKGANSQELILRQAKRIAGAPGLDSQGIIEAGSGAPLVSQPRNGVAAQWVHFGISFDKTMYEYLTSCELYKTGCFNSSAAKVNFPAQSIEIKTAWKIVKDAASAANYYTTTALVVPSEPPASGDSCEQVTVALVGFHLVHKTPLHPEWIWSTFEHVDNSPDCTNPQAPPEGGWSFNDPSCTDCKVNTYTDPCNKNGEFDPDCKELAAPTQVCRENPWGGGTQQNQQHIQDVNEGVQELLGDSVWKNYHMTGNLWKDITQNPPPEAGSLLAANTVAETYLQSINCLTCHTEKPNTKSGEQAADFSHSFSALQGGGACGSNLPGSCLSSQ